MSDIPNRTYTVEGLRHDCWGERANRAKLLHKRAGEAYMGPTWSIDNDSKHYMAQKLAHLFKSDEEAQPLGAFCLEDLICICYLVRLKDVMELDSDFVHDQFGQAVEVGLREFEALQDVEDHCTLKQVAEQYADASPAIQTLMYMRLAALAHTSLSEHEPARALAISRAGQLYLRTAEGGSHLAHKMAYELLLQLESASMELLDKGPLV